MVIFGSDKHFRMVHVGQRGLETESGKLQVQSFSSCMGFFSVAFVS
jgi:hypothetical protein